MPVTGDRGRVAAHLGVVAVATLVALCGVLCGCAGQVRPECPIGAILVRADTDSAGSGSAGASVGVLTQSGTGRAAWRGTGSVDWSCQRLCYPGQTLRASRTERGAVSVECLAAGPVTTPRPPTPAAPDAAPTR